MGQITVMVGERSYNLGCKDGEEDRLRSLAENLNSKTETLKGALGSVSETRMLLMAGLLMADEVLELRESNGSVTPIVRAAPPADHSSEIAEEKISAVTQRLEALAATL
jgi:cell division protein ZapA